MVEFPVPANTQAYTEAGQKAKRGMKKPTQPTIAHDQGRSQYEANRGTCLSHLRFDPSVLFKRSHQ